jgi:phytoene desaturase
MAVVDFRMRKKEIAIIGGGLGGLSAAIYLAATLKKRAKITIYEKESHLGGKMNEVRLGSYRFDCGPGLLTMPEVLRDLFRVCDKQLEDYLDIVQVEPINRYFFQSGVNVATIDASHNLNEFRKEIAKLSEKDSSQVSAFFKYSERIYKRSAPTFLFRSFHDPFSLFDWQAIKQIPFLYQLDPFRTVHEGVASFFESDKVQQLFDRYATYSGSDPFRAPATLNIIPYVEYSLGSYYIKGGMFRLAEALTKLAGELGVSFQCQSEVIELLGSSKKVTGIKIQHRGEINDEIVDAVVSNSDVVWTYQNLCKNLLSTKITASKTKLEPSSSGLVFQWGVKRRHPNLLHHNVFFSNDYRKEFTAIFEKLTIPDELSIYIAITSKTDPDHAPPEGENWFVLVNMPYLSVKGISTWEKEHTDCVRDLIFKRLAEFGINDLSEVIEHEAVITPSDFLRKTYSNCGSIYGISSNSREAAFQREGNASKLIERLFFTGGSANPGGGIPLVLLSGKHAAKAVRKAL